MCFIIIIYVWTNLNVDLFIYLFFSAELVKTYGLSKPNGIVYVPNQIKCDRNAATTLSFNAESSSTEIPELEYQTEVSVHPAYMDSYSIQASLANGSNMWVFYRMVSLKLALLL